MSGQIEVYLDDGRVFSYPVANAAKGREHAFAIATTGYRHVADGVLEHYPAHRINKVKYVGADVTTSFPDDVRGT